MAGTVKAARDLEGGLASKLHLAIGCSPLLSLTECAPGIFALCETWLSPSILDCEVSLPDYQLFHRDRDRHGAYLCMSPSLYVGSLGGTTMSCWVSSWKTSLV